MKFPPLCSRFVARAGLLGFALSILPVAAETVFSDNFTTPGPNRGGSYVSSIVGSTTTVGGGVWGSTTIEAGGWGQTGDGSATPTSSNFLPFTPDPGRIYTVQATIDTTPLGGADPGGTNSWFTLGFTSSLHHWNGVDASTIDTGSLVRWNSNQVATITYSVSGATLATNGIGFVGWITDRPGTVNLNPANEQVKITNFSLISGVANPTLTYDGNGSDGGTVPTDGSSPYAHSATVTVLDDGTMTRSGFNFIGWNTEADGSGTSYSPTATFTIYDDTTLYAQWLSNGLVTLTYDGNGNTGGAAPTDALSPYTSGDSVTVLGAGTLTKISHTFSGWNTASDGSGTSYSADDTFSITSNTTLFAQWTAGPDFVWDNGAVTDEWNAVDLNWNGVAWDNSGSNNAVFTTVGGSVFLAAGITADAVSVGNTAINFPSVNFYDGDLTASSLTVQGNGVNAGNYAVNPTLVVDSTVSISGDAAVGRSNLRIIGGTFTADRIISAPASADWGRLVVSGGTVTATNGVDGSVNTGATFAIDLEGGELRTPSVRVADREVNVTNDAYLTFNGGVLTAIGGDNADFITTYGGGSNAFVGFGGAFIDTNGFNIGILANLRNAGGGLTKDGAGTLTLGGLNNYAGDTTVNSGTLVLDTSSVLTFYPNEGPASNRVTGAGSATFNGEFSIDTSAVTGTTGFIWTLVDRTTLTGESFDPVNFNVIGFTPNVDGVTWEMTDAKGTWTFSEDTGELTLDVGNDYDSWGDPYGLAQGSEGGDLDSDGLTNEEEYAFGLIPNSGASVNPIAVQLDKATGTFSYTRRDPSLTDLTYTIWYSTDLATWTQDTGAVEETPTLVGEVETVPVTITNSLLTNTKLFIQVRAE